MAGGVLKGFGAVLLVVAVVAMLAALAAVAYGLKLQDDARHELVHNGNSRDGEYVLVGGAVALAFGLVLAIVAVVLLVAGGARSRKEMLRTMSGASAGSSLTVPSQPVGPGSDAQRAPGEVVSPDTRSGTRQAFFAVGALVLVAILVAAALLLYQGGSGAAFAGGARSPSLLEAKQFHGSISNTVMTPMGGSAGTTASNNVFPYQVPSGATRVDLNLTWKAIDGGATEMDFYVQDGAGRQLARIAGPSPLRLSVLGAGGEITIRAYPEGTGFVVRQDFEVLVQAFSKSP